MNRTATKIIAALLIALGFLMITGCESTRYIRDAQNHFNQAAQRENQMLSQSLDEYKAGAEASGTASALSDYRMALSLVDTAIEKDNARLRQDKLLGTAYMIKAMSLWRISDLDGNPPGIMESPSNAPKADSSVFSSPERKELMALIPNLKQQLNDSQQGITLGTRDQVMLNALPGLLDHDRGRLAESLERAEAFFTSAYNILNKAGASAPPDHPVRMYLVMAQLQTLNSWAYAIERFGQNMTLPEISNMISGNIHSRVKQTLCPIKVVGERDSDFREQITKFLYLTGISWKDAVKDCK